jgi:hypothetical protein
MRQLMSPLMRSLLVLMMVVAWGQAASTTNDLTSTIATETTTEAETTTPALTAVTTETNAATTAATTMETSTFLSTTDQATTSTLITSTSTPAVVTTLAPTTSPVLASRLNVSVIGPDSLFAGQTGVVSYTSRVCNAPGGGRASNVVISIILPAGMFQVGLVSGARLTCSGQGTVEEGKREKKVVFSTAH